VNPCNHWGLETDPNLELWDQLFWFLAQLICQERALKKAAPANNHIVNPAVHSSPCDWCYAEGFDLMHNGGLLKLLQVYGSVAYASGRAGLPEHVAARRALQETVERALQIEGATEFLAQAFGKDAWWRLPLEHDERGLPPDDEDVNGGLCD